MKNHEHLPPEVLKMVLDITGLINSSLDLDEVLIKATTAAERLLDAEACTIYLLDEDRGDLYFHTMRGAKAGALKTMRLKKGEGVAGWVVREGRPVIINDVSEDTRFAPRFDEESGFTTRAMAAAPLMLKGKTVGAIQVLNPRTQNHFHDDDLILLTALGNVVAAAVENARLYNMVVGRYEMTSEELKEVQARLIRSERLAALYHVMSGVAHEIRNPIMSIGGFASRMQRKLPEGHEFQRYLEIIVKEVNRLNKLVSDVKDFCSLGSASPVEVDPCEFMDERLKSWEGRLADAGVTIEKLYEGPVEPVRLDPKMFKMAVDNIMENSVEAMPRGGAITVRVREEGESLVVSFTDTGRGIAREDLGNVFDPFFTSKTRGVGLGLATVHHVMKEHKGEVKIDSELGKSTTVSLTFPLGEDVGVSAGEKTACRLEL